MEASITISCAQCAYLDTDVCADCVVTFLIEHDPSDALVIDPTELRAVRALERVGLVPGLRHERRAG